jgi:hypothetical protein
VREREPGTLELVCRSTAAFAPASRSCFWCSVGSAVEAASSVADVDYRHRSERADVADGDHVGDLHVAGLRDGAATWRLGLLRLRRTSRIPFEHGGVDDETVARLVEACAQPRVDASAINTSSSIDAVADAYRVAARPVTARSVLSRVRARSDAALLRRSGALLLLQSDEPDPTGGVLLGRALLRVWLAATERGLGVQPLTLPGSPEAVRIAGLFGATRARHSLIVRVGYGR